jgi:hypothetical protein
MFKKLATILAAAMLTMAAGNAFASFSDGDLIRVVYERTGGTVEVATDLGSLSTILATAGSTNYGAGTDAFTTQTGTAFSSSNYYVAYFAGANTSTTTGSMWLSGTDGEGVSRLAGNTANGNFNTLYGTYNGSATGTVHITANTTLVDNSGSGSYNLKSGNNGTFGSVLAVGTPNMDASLTTLAANAPVSENLYYSANYNQGSTGNGKAMTQINAADASGALQILTNSDGSTTIVNGATVSATPIPAAAYLLGSGLLGLFGIRRKNNKV